MGANDGHFDLAGLAPDQLGGELARWMRGIDAAFLEASDAEKVVGHVAALTATMSLLKRLPGFDCDLVALRDLQERLERLSVGQKQPILSVVSAVKTPGRPPESFSDHVRQVRAVSLAQFAINRGWSETDACSLIAKELARIGVRGRRGDPVNRETVQDWLSGKIKATDPLYRLAISTLEEWAPPTLSASTLRKLVRLIIEAGNNIRD